MGTSPRRASEIIMSTVQERGQSRGLGFASRWIVPPRSHTMQGDRAVRNKFNGTLRVMFVVLSLFHVSEGTCGLCDIVCQISDDKLPANASRGDCGAYILAGQTCTMQCPDGYEAPPLTCDAGGAVYHECEAKACPAYTNSEHIANSAGCGAQLPHGHSCAPTCDPGYVMDVGNAMGCSLGVLSSSGTICNAIMDQSDANYNPPRKVRVKESIEMRAQNVHSLLVIVVQDILNDLVQRFRNKHPLVNFKTRVELYPATGRRASRHMHLQLQYDATNAVSGNSQHTIQSQLFGAAANATYIERHASKLYPNTSMYEGSLEIATASLNVDELDSHPSVVVPDRPTGLPCLHCETPLLLADGVSHAPIYKLAMGDRLYSPESADGTPVLGIARTELSPRDVRKVVELPAHTCGEGMPERPIIITKNHAIICEGANRFYQEILPAEEARFWTFPHLANSSDLDSEGRRTTHELCHVHLGDPDVPLFSQGLEMESWDGISAGHDRPYGWAIVPGTTLYVRVSGAGILKPSLA